MMEPSPGDREVEAAVVVGRGRIEGAVEGGPGGVSLAVEELAADLMVAGESGDGGRAGEDVQGQILPLTRRQEPGGAGSGCGGRDRLGLRGGDEGRSLSGLVCFLRVVALAWNPIASMEEAGTSEKFPPVTRVLPDFEPGPKSYRKSGDG